MSTQLEKLWLLAKKRAGYDPAKVRTDPYGKIMLKSRYGKTGRGGCQIDHIKPKSKGGSDGIRNKQLLSSHINMSKKASEVKKSRHSKRNK